MRACGRRRRQRGWSQLELVVSLALLAIFLAVFLERFQYYQEAAEKAALDMTVANMRTGLRYKVADLIMNDRVSEIPTLADENPVTWLQAPPENYLGEFDGPPQESPAGKWYFDRKTRQLVYTVNKRRHFVPPPGGDFSVRYRAERVQAAAGASAPAGGPRAWVRLEEVGNHAWLP
ncbi:MAG TPA: hypothetical protein VFV71_00040 [Burkholderiales bacterium]|nr:hypothetical protein [Burkholderiales bacterium]